MAALVFIIFNHWQVFAASISDDAFERCLARTQKDRLSCESDCGLILQGCYEEGISEATEKSDVLQSKIASKSGGACSTLASVYIEDAKVMERDISRRAALLPGWVASELSLNFARQRLSNLRAIEKSCRQLK
ncbi:hypothetical protein [Burkholderia ambifaria]|uniref:Uncharacterized protein n=1 Tax=Burkholderia ambifaria TaxID=152480 RepID=A0AA41E3Y8_9BURK|nr:hypothetical protein [Burkholderia ambifaria]MBR8128006.1 hypothetical protein [Burkholderia ambifaria]